MSGDEESERVVFFDLETSGLDEEAEVLQIGMKYDCSEFNVYITPKKPIPPEASAINNLTLRDGSLYHKDSKLSTVPQREALERLLVYLREAAKPCVLVAHNCPFDAYYLLRIIAEEKMLQEFADVVSGFTDTLKMLRRSYPDRRSRGQLTLKTLANELSLSTDNVHDAMHDVYLLEKIALHHFNYDALVAVRKSFNDTVCTSFKRKDDYIIEFLRNSFDSTLN